MKKNPGELKESKRIIPKSKITQDMILLLNKRKHFGFNTFAGYRFLPQHDQSMENLARYTIRASSS